VKDIIWMNRGYLWVLEDGTKIAVNVNL